MTLSRKFSQKGTRLQIDSSRFNLFPNLLIVASYNHGVASCVELPGFYLFKMTSSFSFADHAERVRAHLYVRESLRANGTKHELP